MSFDASVRLSAESRIVFPQWYPILLSKDDLTVGVKDSTIPGCSLTVFCLVINFSILLFFQLFYGFFSNKFKLSFFLIDEIVKVC